MHPTSVAVTMGSKTIVEEEKIEKTIKDIPRESFTVLDFVDVFKGMYPKDWKRLVGRLGFFGSKRRYTVTTYLSNRLDTYSQKPYSILVPFTRYKESKKDYRKTTKEEKKIFGSPWIAVYKKKREGLPPGQKSIKRLLRWGKDHPTIGGPVPKIDLKKWVLTIDGEVKKPLKLSWENLLKLPTVKSVSDFHCVEGWSVLGLKWEGISFKHIVNRVDPEKTAKFVSFECADGYTTSLQLEELIGEDILLAYKLDGEYLEEGIGAPLRLVVPNRYAYKSAMWITRIKFTSKKEIGYWESQGYSDTADVWKNDRCSS